MQILDQILENVREEVAVAKSATPLSELESKIKDAPPPRSFAAALRSQGFGLIAEIKKCSPSMGSMRSENVAAAPLAYDQSSVVRGLSILTNEKFFGQDLKYLEKVRSLTRKPILRKDFIIDPYQVFEARAAGADALLLMANILPADEMKALHDLTTELGMEALCEVHTIEEIASLPPATSLAGINARKFKSENSAETFARSRAQEDPMKADFTIHFDAFDLFDRLPANALKIAESGMSADNLGPILARYPFNAALVGTSLLQNLAGIEAELSAFEKAIEKLAKPSAID